MEEGKQIILVLDFRYKKIFSYSMETDPPTRLDDHTNDRVNRSGFTDSNKNDFFLFNDRDPIVLKDDSSQELKDRYPGATTAAKSKRLYPYQ